MEIISSLFSRETQIPGDSIRDPSNDPPMGMVTYFTFSKGHREDSPSQKKTHTKRPFQTFFLFRSTAGTVRYQAPGEES